ncbi:hypothetical protein BpHYR1_050070 [Brachionus plicatilis]|uniref:Uncharacterized protein n=1 Tax=Brachionus plicatilis TaxID=10195 RepID=A0A3M7PQ46_BRAPC|nr:hypothetical protein BpHYR1_050070 [Brachionus plicatilis]
MKKILEIVTRNERLKLVTKCIFKPALTFLIIHKNILNKTIKKIIINSRIDFTIIIKIRQIIKKNTMEKILRYWILHLALYISYKNKKDYKKK